MNCLVIGGGGFIGSHLSEALLNRHDNVTVFDQENAPNLQMLSKKGVKISTGNFLNLLELRKIISDSEIIFHLISTTVPLSSNKDPVYDIESNLVGTVNLLTIAKEQGIKKIIFASSGGTVYGIPQNIPITEQHSTNPTSSYGITKLAIEKYLHLFWTLYGLDYCILRISNAYGERQAVNSAQGIIPMIIDKALHHQDIHIWGDGTIIRDYIYIDDIVEAFLRASIHKNDHKIFNISSGFGHSVNEIITILMELIKEPFRLLYEPGLTYDIPVNILDNSLAKETLSWEPKVNLCDGLRRTVEYIYDRSDSSQLVRPPATGQQKC